MISSESSFMLRPSQLDKTGVGCFALDTVEAGTRLHLSDEPPTRRLRLNQIPDSYLKYCPLLEAGDFLAPTNFGRMAVFWFINHSREPNVLSDGWKLYTNRDIHPDEELTLYYPDLLTHPKNKGWVVPELHV